MQKEIIKEILTESMNSYFPVGRDRSLSFPVETEQILALGGPRNTGKTFLLYDLAQKLRLETRRDRIVYFNFEDARLFPATLKTLDDFLVAYYELYPENRKHKVFFLLDEVMGIENWEEFLRRLFNTEKCSIYITGSSAKSFSTKVSANLGEIARHGVLLTLGFREYLHFNKIKTDSNSGQTVNFFNEYLTSPAFPGLQRMDVNLKRKGLNEYLDLMVYKDIAVKNKISNIHLLKSMIKYLFVNCAQLIPINKIYDDLKSTGLNVSRNSVYEYITCLEESYIILNVPLYSDNPKEQQRNPSKYYPVDNGLYTALTTTVDKEKLIESVVCRQLMTGKGQVFYYKTDDIIDFVAVGNNRLRLISICFDKKSSDLTKRKLVSLTKAMKKLNVDNSYLLTSHWEGEEQTNFGTIKIMSAWKWLIRT